MNNGVVYVNDNNIAEIIRDIQEEISLHNWDKARNLCECALDFDPVNAELYIYRLLVEQNIDDEHKLADSGKKFFNSMYYKLAIRFADNDLKSRLESYCHNIYEKECKLKYREALNLIDSTETDELERALDILVEISDVIDTSKLIKECKYSLAKLYLDSPNNLRQEALGLLEDIDDYQDATVQADLIRAEFKEREELKEQRRVENYNKAINAIEEDTVNSLNVAVSILTALADENADYKDCQSLVEKCNSRISELKTETRNKLEHDAIARATNLLKEDTISSLYSAVQILLQYQSEEAVELRSKCEKRRSELYKETADNNNSRAYDEAVRQMTIGTYAYLKSARNEFSKIADYKDSRQLIEQCDNRLKELDAEWEAKLIVANQAMQTYDDLIARRGFMHKETLQEQLNCLKNLNIAYEVFNSERGKGKTDTYVLCNKCDKRIKYMQELVGDKRYAELLKAYNNAKGSYESYPKNWNGWIKSLNELQEELEFISFQKDSKALLKKVETHKDEMLDKIKECINTEGANAYQGPLKASEKIIKCRDALSYMMDWKDASDVDKKCVNIMDDFHNQASAIEDAAKLYAVDCSLTADNELKYCGIIKSYAESAMKKAVKKRHENPEALVTAYKALSAIPWWPGVNAMLEQCKKNYVSLTNGEFPLD